MTAVGVGAGATATPATAATAGNAADNPDLVQSQITAYKDANSRLREVAKWFVTAATALTALLIGTSPLSGLAGLGWTPKIIPPLAFAVGGLAALGVLVFLASQVLAPATVELQEVLTGKDFGQFRKKIAKDAPSYLGAGFGSVAEFIDRRARDYRSIDDVDKKLSARGLSKAHEEVFREARETTESNIRKAGWVTQRLLAAAENDALWRRFTIARWAAAIGIVITVACIVGFLVTVNAGAAADDLDGPVPVKVALTQTGQQQLAPLLGAQCPLGSFEALLDSGGKTAPWQITVIDPGCQRGTLTITAEQATILMVP